MSKSSKRKRILKRARKLDPNYRPPQPPKPPKPPKPPRPQLPPYRNIIGEWVRLPKTGNIRYKWEDGSQVVIFLKPNKRFGVVYLTSAMPLYESASWETENEAQLYVEKLLDLQKVQ